MPSQFRISEEGTQQIVDFIETQDYPAAYQIIINEMGGTEYTGYDWFYLVQGINENFGYASAYIRSYTWLAEAFGDIGNLEEVTLLSSDQLQQASNLIASSVLQGIVDREGVLPLEFEIYRDDAALATEF